MLSEQANFIHQSNQLCSQPDPPQSVDTTQIIDNDANTFETSHSNQQHYVPQTNHAKPSDVEPIPTVDQVIANSSPNSIHPVTSNMQPSISDEVITLSNAPSFAHIEHDSSAPIIDANVSPPPITDASISQPPIIDATISPPPIIDATISQPSITDATISQHPIIDATISQPAIIDYTVSPPPVYHSTIPAPMQSPPARVVTEHSIEYGDDDIASSAPPLPPPPYVAATPTTQPLTTSVEANGATYSECRSTPARAPSASSFSVDDIAGTSSALQASGSALPPDTLTYDRLSSLDNCLPTYKPTTPSPFGEPRTPTSSPIQFDGDADELPAYSVTNPYPVTDTEVKQRSQHLSL